ncbi:Carboxymuconolactone decarboxylase family protein [Streptomyces sp. YIM 130001]|uniref:carboxymuconolactone decarboxylase family protein n=1 Tax=Streptomyces sp. YIM 130001 TaxID=2259644 RepID=UPI000E65BA80|nr:carboxymuconolactone decarboxylase family protein [Streptomyces sp. YIM 130001]RII09281.1 Carboxymuconolactone decarboxylase family protein [Streptomyces sp. YIM 130001]
MSGPFRFTSPTAPKNATGRAAEVYRQLAGDFGTDRASTFTVLSAAPELLAAAWSLVRESLLVGPDTRTGREVAALGVSLANRCRFCIDAHTIFLHATGDAELGETIAAGGVPDDPEYAGLLAWAKASRAPGAAVRPAPPFPADRAPGYLGTVLAFHFINRIASALLTESVLPCDLQRMRAVRSAAGRSFRHAVRADLPPGESLVLLGEEVRQVPQWAGNSPVGHAYAALRSVALMGAAFLDPDEQRLLNETLTAWDGAHPAPYWPELPGRDRPALRLALLAAIAPYRIEQDDIDAWRTPQHTDHCLVHLVSYGAFLAVERAEAALTTAAAREAS